MPSIAELRQEYDKSPLLESDVAADPIVQFHRWFEDARQADITEPNAMTLATCSPDGAPSARIVLLKEVDDRGFTFYTSYVGEKASQLADNPQASLVFWWDALQRQVRVDGQVTRVSRQASEQYFSSRPRPSQIGAWASHQSQPIASRDQLAQQFDRFEKEHEGHDIPTPPFWGGYRVLPKRIQFWQGQRSRLHDRLRYTRTREGHWTLERLAP